MSEDSKYTWMKSKTGRQMYERSVSLLMLKAFYDVVGREKVSFIKVEHTLSSALFVRAEGGFYLDQALLSRVEARMKELSNQAIPIRQRVVSVEEAVDLFEREKMPDKAQLLHFQVDKYISVCTLDDYTDYFYGAMVPDTSYVDRFELRLFEGGFVIILPDAADPERLAVFAPSMKVSKELLDSTLHAEKLGLSAAGELNTRIAEGNTVSLILAQEAMMEKKIGMLAEQIRDRKGVRFVMIAGPSSSGKTTFSHRLCTQLIACGLKPHALATDNYFVNREDTPKCADGQYDFECLGAVDVPKFNEDMTRLLAGEQVEIPTFNFKKGMREYNGNFLKLGEDDILVIEGIHCLNDALSYSLPEESKFRIYISCLTTMNVDDHTRIPTTDARLLRRIARDVGARGYSAATTIARCASVSRGEEKNIFPFQDRADVIFNSSLLYEMAVLKPYVEPLLFSVPRDAEEYPEAKRLLTFLSYFLTIPADAIPDTSLLREFIGGGCYQD